MPPSLPLTRIILWGQQLLAEILRPGDLAIDLTAGNGHDTLFLAGRVGPQGTVVAFDIQAGALDKSATRLAEAGVACRFVRAPGDPAVREPGVALVHDSHALLDRYLDAAPRAIIANLGYLPGGDKALTTRPGSTLVALRQGLALLQPGGRMALVIYLGHPGGADEAAAVDALFGALPPRDWQALRIEVANRAGAPYLMVVEKL